jgi:hypothetical protein
LKEVLETLGLLPIQAKLRVKNAGAETEKEVEKEVLCMCASFAGPLANLSESKKHESMLAAYQLGRSCFSDVPGVWLRLIH